MLTVDAHDRRFVSRVDPPRRVNAVGRLIVDLHRRYYRPEFVPVLWIVAVATDILLVMLVALAR
jgi:hypothetical protein